MVVGVVFDLLLKPSACKAGRAEGRKRSKHPVLFFRKVFFRYDEVDDKDTKNNRGIMANPTDDGKRTSKFEMKDLPTEVARVVEKLSVGEMSKPFTMVDNRGRTMCVLAKLRNRTEAHKATITEDFPLMSEIVLEKAREKKLREWVQDKIKNTYVRIPEEYKDCDFEYEGWIR